MTIDALAAIDQWRPVIEKRLDELVPEASGPIAPLHAAMRYSLLAPGKRLRPALCLICAGSVGGSPLAALDPACSLEMIHCFSLIHDDLPAIDNDDLRRGRPSLHRAFPEGTAILAGDALFALAFQVTGKADSPAPTIVRAFQILAKSVGSRGLVGGEFCDLDSEGSPPDADRVEFIHARKTGALFAAACEMGALFGGGSEDQAKALKSYGADLGLAFQIADDLLNETGAEGSIGKSVGSDQARGKQTYPSVYGLEKSAQLATEAVQRAISQLEKLGGQTEELAAIARFAADRRS